MKYRWDSEPFYLPSVRSSCRRWRCRCRRLHRQTRRCFKQEILHTLFHCVIDMDTTPRSSWRAETNSFFRLSWTSFQLMTYFLFSLIRAEVQNLRVSTSTLLMSHVSFWWVLGLVMLFVGNGPSGRWSVLSINLHEVCPQNGEQFLFALFSSFPFVSSAATTTATATASEPSCTSRANLLGPGTGTAALRH